MDLNNIEQINITDLAREWFGIDSDVEPMCSYAGHNYCLTEKNTGTKYVFKISEPGEDFACLEAQHAMMHHLSKQQLPFSTPVPVKGKNLKEIIPIPNGTGYMRILSFIEGSFLCKLRTHPNELLEQWGHCMAQLDQALQGFNHNGFKQDHIWDFQNISKQAHKLEFCNDARIQKVIRYYFLEYINFVKPRLDQLERAVIHNDGNDHNIVVSKSKEQAFISGLIDFGDAVYSYHICELAIACTYAMLEKRDPINALMFVVKGYHRHRPLSIDEIELLPFLIGARLALSISISSYEFEQNLQNTYILVSQKGARNLINHLISLNPKKITEQLCKHCQIPYLGTQYQNQVTGLVQKRKKLLSANLSLSYQSPIIMERGAFQYLFSHDGTSYLDCVNNVSHVGHCHPQISQVAEKQMRLLNTNTRYLHPEILTLAEKLTAKLPEGLDTCFFVCSGSEANELAIRLARAYTGQRKFITMEGAYHGNTSSLIDLSPYKNKGPGGQSSPDWVYEAPLPYATQSQKEDHHTHLSKAEDSIKFIKELCMQNGSYAGFICESMPGCAGQIELPLGYLQEVYQIVRAHGGVCIADEIQVGFGRIGQHFWGFEKSGVIPDIVTLGKPMGNGHPIAAVVTSKKIAEAFNNGMEYFNSFGGNPVSCAIANAVLNIIDHEGLQEHALKAGQTLKNALNELKTKTPIIEEIRGQGLFLGIELTNKCNGKDIKKYHPQITEAMKSRGVLLSLDGIERNVLKIKPPLCISYDNLEALYSNFKEVIVKIVQSL